LGVIGGEEAADTLGFGRWWIVGTDNGPVFEENCDADGGVAFSVCMRGKSAGPSDIAMAGGVKGIATFGEGPFSAGVGLAQGKEIGGNVGLGSGEMLFGNGELVHKGEGEVVFFSGEVDLEKATGVMLGSFPTDLAAEAGLITGGLKVGEVLKEIEENGLEEVPVFGAASEESAEPEIVTFGFVDVNASEVTLAGSGDVESEAGVVGSGPHP
jgi:hypothetical protein